MRRQAFAIALSASFLAAPAAFADDAKPDAAHLRAAAGEFDAGVNALRKKDFEGAAAHFEAADAAVPSAKVLRQAIKARSEAGQGAQASTLAVLALERHHNDDVLAKLARDTIEKFEPLLYKVKVSCAAPCLLSVGSQGVPGAAGARRVVYLDPGKATINAAFPDKDPPADPSREVEATAGGSTDLRFEIKKAAPPPPPPPDPETPSKSDTPPEDPKPDPEPPSTGGGKGISPAFFGVGLAATVGLSIATIWSGVDTQNNPGAAAVMAACQGKGTSCPLYQEGLSKQNRTNALLGTTAGTAAVTVVLAVFTNWRGGKKPPSSSTGLSRAPNPRSTMGASPPNPMPTLSAVIVDHGAVLGAVGAF
jgi:hypothetical protein